jgi:acetoin utilization deacetylase AcuC-like enzyme
MSASQRAAQRIGTGWVYHERYAWHDTGTAAGMVEAGGWLEPLAHLDTAATRARLHSLVEVSGLGERLVRLVARPASDEELEAVHQRGHIDRIEALSAGHGGDAGDGVSPFGKGGAEIARLSAGGAIVAVEAVLRGEVRNAYALVRPAGHHALPDRGMGFCIFNNIAIAVEHALSAHSTRRVAVVDWDVHHGNGTQAIFYEREDVLTISIHQDRCYPVDSGGVEERGAQAGLGTNVNVPLPAGSGDGAYAEAMRRVVMPALERFGPELVVVGSGFDANAYDPLGRMLLHSESYR